MEKKVLEANTLRGDRGQGTINQKDYMEKARDVYKYKGRLLLGDGQKARLELTWQRDGKESKVLGIADGKQIIGFGESLDTRDKPFPQYRIFTALCGQYTARHGLMP